MRRRFVPAAVVILAVALGLTAATRAKPVTFTLPAESSMLKKTPAPGYLRADLLCVTCHSRDYMTTQPPGKGKDFWLAEVNKMVTVYGAAIPEPDRAAIAEYLASAY